jgi:hypothetical protein
VLADGCSRDIDGSFNGWALSELILIDADWNDALAVGSMRSMDRFHRWGVLGAVMVVVWFVGFGVFMDRAKNFPAFPPF